MSDIPNPQDTSNPSPSQGGGGSLLASILATAENGQLESAKKEETNTSFAAVIQQQNSKTAETNTSTPPLPPKKPMSPKDFLRFLGAIVGVGLIVFGSFLAYVVFNPEQAQFFISLGINPADIQNFLKKLVTIIFGVITGTLSIVWIITLFKAILTKKEFQKTKTIFTILAVFVGLMLFSEITLWAYLYKVIGDSDYANASGSILIYDNALLNSTKYSSRALISDLNNVVGPVTLRFDLSSNTKQVAKTLNVMGYSIDFDGDGKPEINKPGINPANDQGIYWTFGQVASADEQRKEGSFYGNGVYRPIVTYLGNDRITGKPSTKEVDIGAINIVGSVVYKEAPQATGGKRVAIDASGIADLGTVEWYKAEDLLKPDLTGVKYAPDVVFKDEDGICMKLVIGGSRAPDCTRFFVIGNSGGQFQGTITHKQDTKNPLTFTFAISDMKSKAGIKKYSWLINDNFVIDALDSLEYTFTDYGKQKVSVKITDFAGNTYELLDEFNLLRPLKLATLKEDNHVVTNSLLKVTDSNGNSLINDTYNKEENVYDITDFDIPQTSVTFNANSVRVTDPKYDLINVDWDFDGDGKFEQKGKVVKHDFLEEKKYTVTAHYTFISNEKSDEQYLDETLIFDGKKKEIIPRLKIIPDSEYAPTTVRFDASASETKAGTITKFTYDFGEGKPPVDGDAQMQYRYILGGDYIVKLTVTKDDGTKETIARRLVLKDGSKNVTINTSASSGIIGSGIDFDAAGSAGQITEYAWDFGDNSTSTEPRPTHIYQSAGTFTVSLKVTYLDGTLKDTTKDIVIKDPTATNEPIPQ